MSTGEAGEQPAWEVSSTARSVPGTRLQAHAKPLDSGFRPRIESGAGSPPERR